MLNLETLHDISVSKIQKELNLEYWVEELFKKYSIDGDDKINLGHLIKNFEDKWMKTQKEEQKVDINQINLMRDMSIMELIYHYTNTLEIRKIIDVRVIEQPIGLLFNLKTDSETVTSKTFKSESVDNLFIDIQEDLKSKLINVLTPEIVKMSDLKDYLNESKYDKIFYNSSVKLDSKSFKPMCSNAMIIRTMEINKEINELKYSVNDDEIILKKTTSEYDKGFIFSPYLMPMRTINHVDNDFKINPTILARYGAWISPNINDYYKRVVVEL